MRNSVVILTLLWSIFCFAAPNTDNILFIHSYDNKHGWTKEIESGFTETLKSYASVNIYHEYIDAKRFPQREKQESFYRYLLDKYTERDIKAVVISDDPAMNLYLKYSEKQLDKVPVFFMGINKINQELIDAQHITGVFENRKFDQALIDMKRVMGIDEIIILSDSSSPGMTNTARIMSAKKNPTAPQIMHIVEDATIQNLASKFRLYPKNIPIVIAGQLRDAENDELLSWEQTFIELGNRLVNPYFVHSIFGVEGGALGCYQLDPSTHAKKAAQLLIKYLNGVPIEKIKAITEVQSTWYWNGRKINNYKLTKEELPAGSILLFEDNSIYEFDQKMVISIAVFMLVLFVAIILLLFIIRHSKLTEKALREKVRLTEKLEYEASHDYLTGLFNRRTFNTLLSNLQKEGFKNAADKHIYVAALDLDNFKAVNDSVGHIIGDNLLIEVSELMAQHISPNDTLARLGGDEFGLIMPDRTKEEVSDICRKIIAAVGQYRLIWNETSYGVGVSIGVVKAQENDQREVLTSHADIACYKAKECGKNNAYFTDSNDSSIQTELTQLGYIADITGALENNQFYLAKQLIHPLSHTEKNPHYEILLRYNDKNGNAISPALFIPTAEKHGLITIIDKWVVKTVLSKYKTLFPDEDPILSINLSGVSLSNSTFLQEVLEIVDNNDIDMRKICFEVTETAVVSHINRAITFIKELKKTGCQFALDDFGSGSSSYGYLKTLPVDYLKIDGSLIQSILSEPVDQAIVKSINEIAHGMNMKTIAEFVENEQIITMLNAIGVDYGQGYGIHKPQACIDSTSQP